MKIGKNILGGILGPRRARGVSRGRGWGPVPAGLLLRGPWLWQCEKISGDDLRPSHISLEGNRLFNYSQNICLLKCYTLL